VSISTSVFDWELAVFDHEGRCATHSHETGIINAERKGVAGVPDRSWKKNDAEEWGPDDRPNVRLILHMDAQRSRFVIPPASSDLLSERSFS
jgi:hypothetical protein